MVGTAIHFAGNCDEAISFYQEVFGAEVIEINYAKDAPAGNGMEELPPNFVMHSDILINGTVMHLTDGAQDFVPTSNYSFMVTKNTDDEVKVLYEKLLDGGKIVVELAPAFWSSMYGMVVDKFGVCWQVMTSE
jgi:PhnB protein